MIIVIDLGQANTSELISVISKITADYKLSSVEMDICNADKVIIVGYGEASPGIRKLHLLNLFSVLRIIKKPMLGIGLGMQLLCRHSAEGNVACLGVLSGSTEKFEPPVSNIRHIGFDPLNIIKQSKLFVGLNSSDKFYFDHGYFIPQNEHTTSTSENGVVFSASMENGNCYGVQFHPEKSGDAGIKLLKNFIEL